CHSRLGRAVEVGVKDRNPKPARAQRAREMQRQRALADPALAGAHRHEMTYPGETVGDAGALLGNLLENSGASVADDVVVALHLLFGGLIAYTATSPLTSSRSASAKASARLAEAPPARRRSGPRLALPGREGAKQ